MEKIRILEMIDKPFLGGGQINLLSLARNLDKAKFDVSVCSQVGGALEEEVKKNQIKFFPVTFNRRKWRKTIREISFILRNQKIEILHTHGGVAGLFGRWAAHKSGMPVIVHTLHGIHYLHYRNVFLKFVCVFLERYFSRFTDALIFVSGGDRKEAKKYKLAPIKKMALIKNGIDFSKYKNIKANNKVNRVIKLNLEPSAPVVGTVARLHRQKGLIYLFKAAKKIQQAFPKIKILIVGQGPLRKKLEKAVKRLNIEQWLRFMGERKDIPELLSLFDVLVLPSLWEGLPYVLLEAAALAKPVVATDVSGTREIIINGETGILVPPKNHDKLAQAIISLLKDREYALRLGGMLKKEICPVYTLSRMVEETERLYLELYKKKRLIFL